VGRRISRRAFLAGGAAAAVAAASGTEPASGPGIPVVILHRVSPYARGRQEVTADEVWRMLASAKNAGFVPVALEDIVHGTLPSSCSGKKPFAITFDDAHVTQFRLLRGRVDPDCAFGILTSFYAEPKATFFINTDNGAPPFLSESAVKLNMIVEAGMSVGNHGASHVGIDRLSLPGMLWEMGRVRAFLDESLGGKLKDRDVYFAYPFGSAPQDPERLALVRRFTFEGKTYEHPAAFVFHEGWGADRKEECDAMLCPPGGVDTSGTAALRLPRLNVISLRDFRIDILEREDVYLHRSNGLARRT
jgi:peptidoglycan/xylan/chitin deacetylase (PgdA/CDA1 family)